ncbi:MAG: hypothetical protein KJ663_01195 [Proteobacteria bacterium]|nr:hypothetical protein [Pseudomonadota bacterium]
MKTEDNKTPFISLLFIIIFLSFSSSAYSASESVFASYKYTMGDNDTKNDAKRICFLEAKRLAIEKAGTYIESSTEIKNFNLTRDEIKTFAGAIVKVEIASEEIKFVGENQIIFMTVKADVDIGSFRERVKQIKSDRELEKKVIDQQRQLQGLEDNLKKLQQQLTTKNIDEVVTLRKERVEAFGKMDELEKVKFDIKSKAKTAIQNLERGMTPQEVIKFAGEPRSKVSHGSDLKYNYGNVWVVIESGVVSCIVKAEAFVDVRDCDGYKIINRNAIIK